MISSQSYETSLQIGLTCQLTNLQKTMAKCFRCKRDTIALFRSVTGIIFVDADGKVNKSDLHLSTEIRTSTPNPAVSQKTTTIQHYCSTFLSKRLICIRAGAKYVPKTGQ